MNAVFHSSSQDVEKGRGGEIVARGQVDLGGGALKTIVNREKKGTRYLSRLLAMNPVFK